MYFFSVFFLCFFSLWFFSIFSLWFLSIFFVECLGGEVLVKRSNSQILCGFLWLVKLVVEALQSWPLYYLRICIVVKLLDYRIVNMIPVLAVSLGPCALS